ARHRLPRLAAGLVEHQPGFHLGRYAPRADAWPPLLRGAQGARRKRAALAHVVVAVGRVVLRAAGGLRSAGGSGLPPNLTRPVPFPHCAARSVTFYLPPYGGVFAMRWMKKRSHL